MKKQINIQKTENGIKYFHIYEVRAVKFNDEVITFDRFLSEKEANKTIEVAMEVHGKRYKTMYVMRHIVWC